MNCIKLTTYSITDLSEHEMSAIQAGLVLLANGAREEGGASYPEYKRTAGVMLGQLDIPGTANQ